LRGRSKIDPQTFLFLEGFGFNNEKERN